MRTVKICVGRRRHELGSVCLRVDSHHKREGDDAHAFGQPRPPDHRTTREERRSTEQFCLEQIRGSYGNCVTLSDFVVTGERRRKAPEPSRKTSPGVDVAGC